MRVTSSERWNTKLLFRSYNDFSKYRLYTILFIVGLILTTILVYIGNNDPGLGDRISANREYNGDSCRTLVIEKLLGHGEMLVEIVDNGEEGVLRLMDNDLILSEGDTIRYNISLSSLEVNSDSKSLLLWIGAYNYPVLALCLLIVISIVYNISCPDLTYRNYEKVKNVPLQEFMINNVPRILGFLVLLYIAYGIYYRITY